jgi:hypothetical protein
MAPKHPVDAVVEQFSNRDGAWLYDIQEALETAYQQTYLTHYPIAALMEVTAKLRKQGVRIWNSID